MRAQYYFHPDPVHMLIKPYHPSAHNPPLAPWSMKGLHIAHIASLTLTPTLATLASLLLSNKPDMLLPQVS